MICFANQFTGFYMRATLALNGLKGMTQNHNERFNAKIWARIPKSTYVLFSQLQLGVYDTAGNFNIVRKASIFMFDKLCMILGKLEGCKKINGKRLTASKYDNLEVTKKPEKVKRCKAKTKGDKNNDTAGAL